MKTICLNPKRYVVAISLAHAGVLLPCYGATANPRGGDTLTAVLFNAMNRHLAAATFGRGVYILGLVEPRVRPRPIPHEKT
jgi:hypothetical protein